MYRNQSSIVWITFVFFLCVTLFLPQSCSQYPSGRADKIFINGHVLTMDEIMPGIIESHGHLLSLDQSFFELNLEGIPSLENIVQKVRDRVKENPAASRQLRVGKTSLSGNLVYARMD